MGVLGRILKGTTYSGCALDLVYVLLRKNLSGTPGFRLAPFSETGLPVSLALRNVSHYK
jgi:hypothetical protein